MHCITIQMQLPFAVNVSLKLVFITWQFKTCSALLQSVRSDAVTSSKAIISWKQDKTTMSDRTIITSGSGSGLVCVWLVEIFLWLFYFVKWQTNPCLWKLKSSWHCKFTLGVEHSWTVSMECIYNFQSAKHHMLKLQEIK